MNNDLLYLIIKQPSVLINYMNHDLNSEINKECLFLYSLINDSSGCELSLFKIKTGRKLNINSGGGVYTNQ